MDKLSLVGLVLAAVAIVGGQLLEGGSLGSLVQFAAFLIVIGWRQHRGRPFPGCR